MDRNITSLTPFHCFKFALPDGQCPLDMMIVDGVTCLFKVLEQECCSETHTTERTMKMAKSNGPV